MRNPSWKSQRQIHRFRFHQCPQSHPQQPRQQLAHLLQVLLVQLVPRAVWLSGSSTRHQFRTLWIWVSLENKLLRLWGQHSTILKELLNTWSTASLKHHLDQFHNQFQEQEQLEEQEHQPWTHQCWPPLSVPLNLLRSARWSETIRTRYQPFCSRLPRHLPNCSNWSPRIQNSSKG